MSKRKEALGKGIRALLSVMDEDTEVLKINENDEDSIINTEHCILKRIFNSVKRFNANVNS